MCKHLSVFIFILLFFSVVRPTQSIAQSTRYTTEQLYQLFQNPPQQYRPFVRWWWNGDKVAKNELCRELHLLSEAGIGGVEINPIEFPTHGDDSMGIRSLQWLSSEWMSCVETACDTAASLGLTCDLLVGSGWPIGGEEVPVDERAQIVCPHALYVTGDTLLEVPLMELYAGALPKVSSPNDARECSLLELALMPNPCDDMREVQYLTISDYVENDTLRVRIPSGPHTLVVVVRVRNFMCVIDGAPGARGPVVDHFNHIAVEHYLHRMSDALAQHSPKPISARLRAYFMDSMELEGANWNDHFADAFRQLRGYDIQPWLPFILRKTRGMGDPVSYAPIVPVSDSLNREVQRVRYDFERTKAELLRDNFTRPYTQWCHQQKVLSRAQAYGRGFFPLESSLEVDLPECESWTTNWLRHKPGEEMSERDYRRGRAYTMVNKYVSSAAHLAGKRLVSCEEMTNTYNVFNLTLQQLKIGGDMSIASGVTHSVFHGFNYMPQNAPFPGWIRYGAFYNEHNNWWPYFPLYNDYKARIYSVLQNVKPVADIAVLNPDGDMWSEIGMQNEPFPNTAFADWKTLVWEAIVKNGGSCDYLSEEILRNAAVDDGIIRYGESAFSHLFLLNIKRLSLESAAQIERFVQQGGTVICLENIPSSALGNHLDNAIADSIVSARMESLRTHYASRFLLLHKPDSNYIDWYAHVQPERRLPHAITIENPNLYLYQNHYVTDDGNDVFFFCNVHRYQSISTKIRFSQSIINKGKRPSVWNPETGMRTPLAGYRDGTFELSLPNATSLLIVLDDTCNSAIEMRSTLNKHVLYDTLQNWKALFVNSLSGEKQAVQLDTLSDLLNTPYRDFTGTIFYTKKIKLNKKEMLSVDLGVVEGISELYVNGHYAGVRWYGKHCYQIDKEWVKKGNNVLEVRVTTVMGNYVKMLTDNAVAQYWTNAKNKNQPWQPQGLVGPVKVTGYGL